MVGTSQLAYLGSFSLLWLNACLVLCSVFNTLLLFAHLSSQRAFGISAVLGLILKTRKLSCRDIRKLTEGDRADHVTCMNTSGGCFNVSEMEQSKRGTKANTVGLGSFPK